MKDKYNFDQIVDQHKNLVYHIIFRITNDSSNADEIFQEVFLNVFSSISKFKGKSKLSTWISSIAINTCYTFFKQTNKKAAYSLDQFMEEKGDFISSEISITEKMESEEINSNLSLKINMLPIKYKIALILFYLEGNSYIEISEILKVPIGTVKTHLFRGLKMLKNVMGGNLNGFMQKG